jgi:alanine dehydrogenase
MVAVTTQPRWRLITMLTVSLLRESRPGERRVLLLPAEAAKLSGICRLQVETGAGTGLGIPDSAYQDAGALIAAPAAAWQADLLLKLKAPTISEITRICRPAAVAALFHAEGNPDLVTETLDRDITAYSFEYFQDDEGRHPLMAATGEIAGQMAVIYAAYHLQSHLGGSGVALQACAHVPGAHVAVIGYGNAGQAAARAAATLGAQVTVWTRNAITPPPDTLIEHRVLSDPAVVSELAGADVIIGAIRISTYDTPPVVTEGIVQRMRPGSVIVDVTAGFGAGFIETSGHLTTLDDPCRPVHGVKHIKIRTLPLGVHRTAATQISRLYLPYVRALAASLSGGPPDPVSERGKIISGGQILNEHVRKHYQAGYRE